MPKIVIREVGCFTPELRTMAQWMIECGIQTAAMEATGVYWIPVFQMLESMGIEVKLVNAHYVKTVPGRKSDVLDCQWLQKLHTFGLLSGSFRPDDQVCVLRSYIRQRDSLIKSATTHVQRLQKALIQMNLQLHKVISDITGGKIKSSQTRKVINRAANAFRLAAQAVSHSRSALGAFYRRVRSRLGAPKAITATAHKLARLFYRMWTTHGEYTDPGMDYYEQKYHERVVNKLKKKAQSLGFELVAQPDAAESVS